MSNKKMLKKMFDEEYNRKKTKEEILTNYEKSINKKVKYFKWSLVPLCFILIIFLISSSKSLNSETDKKFDIEKYYNSNDTDSFDDKYNDLKNDNKEEYTGKKIINISSSPDYAYNLQDSNVLTGLTDYIALIRIDSIDGYSNYNNVKKIYYQNPYTYGTATILKIFKGEIPSEKITYTRVGGIIPYEDYLKGDIDPDKLEAVRKQYGDKNVSPKDIYVKYKPHEDIEIEIGKTYLVYMNYYPRTGFENEYTIFGFQYGFREIQNSSNMSSTMQDFSNLKVKNNVTGEWEDISKVINLSKAK